MKITYNIKNINKINRDLQLVLLDTGEAIKTDLIQSQTMPFEIGTLQNDSTFVDDKRIEENKVKIVSDTPYARKMYFHPEYHFNTSKNPNAGGRWFEPYINGEKKSKVLKYYQQFAKRRIY